jgi:hypothetical protein
MSSVRMFVNGQAMTGGTLHHALAEARFLAAARTAPRYRFYSVRDEFPGLHPSSTGSAVPGELYELDLTVLREELLPNEPPELELTVIELDDRSASLCMRLRTELIGQPGVQDITAAGGWRTHLESLA